MLDLSHIPNSQQDVKIFYSNGVTNAWQTWNKPRKCNYVWIMCIGGAGGGAGITARGGGSGAVTKALYSGNIIPEILYIQVGLGGLGAVGSGTPGAGNRSFVSMYPNNTIPQNLVCTSGQAAATNTGVGETAATSTSATFLSLANFQSTAGISSVVDVPVTPFTSQIVTPGGGCNSTVGLAGSSILASSITPLISGGAGSSTGDGGNGQNGFTSWKPFFSLGGAGGGNTTFAGGVGGTGGNGGIGSGGGSGGYSSSGGLVFSNSGKGGDGLVVIISF
jgi:hypothetical protein